MQQSTRRKSRWRETRRSESTEANLGRGYDLKWGVNVLGYGRSSTSQQDLSTAQQTEEILKEAISIGALPEGAELEARHDSEGGLFLDDGVSGWKHDPEERAGSRDLLRRCEHDPQPHDQPGILIIWSLSRLGRFEEGAEEAIYWLHRLRRLGWIVHSITQPGLSEDADDRLVRVFRAAIDSEKDTAESEGKSIDGKRGKESQLKKGLWAGGIAPFGYERWAVSLDHDGAAAEWIEPLPRGKRNPYQHAVTLLRPSESAAVVREVFELFSNGRNGEVVSTESIARLLNQRGTPTHKDGACWYHTTITKILTNERYLAIQRDSQGASHEAKWEALIGRELWDKAQRRLKENAGRRSGVNSSYPLSGLLQCAACGQPLHGDTTDGIRYYKSRKRPTGERCEACRFRIRADVVEPPVLDAIPEIADHAACLKAIEEEQRILRGESSRRARLNQLNVELSELKQQVDRLVDVITIGGAAAASAQAKIGGISERIAMGERERERLLGTTEGSPVVDHASAARHFTMLYEAAAPAEKQQLIRQFVIQIEVEVCAEELHVSFRRPPGSLAS